MCGIIFDVRKEFPYKYPIGRNVKCQCISPVLTLKEFSCLKYG